MKVLPSQHFTKGRWRNGMGTSWEIATHPDGSGDTGFHWRMALAQIDESVPFSHYENIDRIFTLIKGGGLDLALEGRPKLHIASCFVPHAFPGEVKTDCNLHGGPCVALNIFFDRRRIGADVGILEISESRILDATDTMIVFALRGAFILDGQATLNCGDAVKLEVYDRVEIRPTESNSLLYTVLFKPL